MLTRRLLHLPSASPSNALLRSFSTSTALHRTPALSDIVPDTAHHFDNAQKEFRASLAAAQKQKEQAESQSATVVSKKSTSSSLLSRIAAVTSPTAPGVSNASSATNPSDSSPSASDSPNDSATATAASSEPKILGSLSIGEARQAVTDDSTSKRNPFSSLIYGTKEGQQMDKDMERSFSQVLARGKYVHSIVFHDVKPDKVDEYTELVGSWYPRMASMPENKVNLVGSWRTEVGDCDTFVHIWEYQRYHGYHSSLHTIASHPEFPAFDKKLKTLINSKKTSVMQEFSFWPTTPPRRLGGLFELRSYTLHPGNLLEWETHWRRGLKARKEVMEGVGAWFVQIGDLNTVHHLWQFADLEERKVRREQSWGVEGWSDTVHKTVPLIQTMKSKILIPMEWSPVG